MEQLTTVAPGAATARTESVTVNDRQLVYRTIGQGSPMILCQRFRGNLDDWDPAFLDGLARYYQVYIFDYSGFGCSTGQPATDMLGFAQDVLDLADGLGIGKFLLMGWSFGGWVAQIVTTEYPERVEQLILLGTKPPGKVSHPITELFFETAYIEENTFEHEVILFFEPASESSRVAAKASHDRINARTEYRDIKIPPPLWSYYGKGGEDFTLDPYHAREKLQHTNKPILVISGDHEICFPVENWFELNRLMPTMQLIVFPRAGHGPHHQHPELAVNYIHAFIQHHQNTAP